VYIFWIKRVHLLDKTCTSFWGDVYTFKNKSFTSFLKKGFSIAISVGGVRRKALNNIKALSNKK
jgi:hypothetical protein